MELAEYIDEYRDEIEDLAALDPFRLELTLDALLDQDAECGGLTQ